MATIRVNSAQGEPGHLVTTANSDQHGDAWSTVAGHVAYDHRPDTGWPSLRIGSPVAPASSVARTTGTQTALSASVYLWVPSGANVTVNVGGTSATHPSVVFTAAGGLTLGGAAVSAAVASACRDRLVRVEVSATGGTATYRLNYANPTLSTPDHTATASYSGTLSTVRILAAASSRAWLSALRVGQGEWAGAGIIGPAAQPAYTSQGLWVQLAQQDLMAAGYPLPQWQDDGFYGQEMSDALQQFQADHGLDVDGLLGPEARATLSQVLNPGRYPTAVGPVGWGVPIGV